MIIANDVSDSGIGFYSEENEVTVLWPEGEQPLTRANKAAIARQIMELIAERCECPDRQKIPLLVHPEARA